MFSGDSRFDYDDAMPVDYELGPSPDEANVEGEAQCSADSRRFKYRCGDDAERPG